MSFPSCFSENGVQVSDSSSSSSSVGARSPQNLVTLVYQCLIEGQSYPITFTWGNTMVGHMLTVGVDDNSSHCLCKIDVKPWLFSKKKGSKTLEVDSRKVVFYWDLSSARFGSGPEPLEGYYLAIVSDLQLVLLLGDLRKDAFKKAITSPAESSARFLAKKENILGKTVFSTKAQFSENGRVHDLLIECETNGKSEPCLIIRVDFKTLLKVKRLHWKLRGNDSILVDGELVDVYWDVYSWLFGSSLGSAVFMFKTFMIDEKMQNSRIYDPNIWSWSFLKPIQESDSQNLSFRQRLCDSVSYGLGFSFIIYAWKNE